MAKARAVSVSTACLTKDEIIHKGMAIDTELCVMCGLCVAVCPVSALTLVQSEVEPFIAFSYGCSDCGLCYHICPGKDIPLRDLDKFVFGRERNIYTEAIGIIRNCYQANAVEPEIRARGASGGVVTALLLYALERKRIAAANVVGFDKVQPWKAKPILATTRDEIIGAANSKYTIVPTLAVLAESKARRFPGNIGCVGLPCQIHGLRKLQCYYPNHRLSKKIAFTIGIHCNSARPMSYNEYILREQFGIKSLEDIRSLDYRKGKAPNAYAEVVKRNGEVVKTSRYVWMGHRDFFSGRCLLCWDWGAELADVSVGDFLGPAASGSDVHLGASTLIVRTEVGDQLVREAVDAGYLKVYPTPTEPLLYSPSFLAKKFGRATALMAIKKFGWLCPDYQYQILPVEQFDKVGLSGGVSIEERELFWARKGVHALA